MIILSITNHSESSASIYNSKNKKLIAASEERFSRIKNSSGIPYKTINFLLNELKISLSKVDKIIYCSHESAYPSKQLQKQINNESRLLNDYDKKVFWHRYNTEVKFNKKSIKKFENWYKKNKIKKNKVYYLDHHEAHARSAIITQRKKNGYILTCDGKGGFTSSSIWYFNKKKLKCLSRNTSFNSLGYLYGNVTIGLGYQAERHEGKLTGLSARGKPVSKIGFTKVFKVKDDKIIARNIKNNFIPFFLKGKNYWDMENFFKDMKKYSKENISATVQNVIEKIIVKYVKKNIPKNSNLLLSGGIFANVKLNQKVKEINSNRYLFVTPPMSDFGLCLGGIHKYSNDNSTEVKNMYLGPKFSNEFILKILKRNKKISYLFADSNRMLTQFIVNNFKNKKIFAIFNDRMEFGPRSLCNRSIVFPATKKDINDKVNKRLNRSDFMPFAPVMLDKYTKNNLVNYKNHDELSRFMTVTYKCKNRFVKKYPAAIHVDKTIRPQILFRKDNKWFYDILENYKKITKEECLMNTSFNSHEEPIICNPQEAINSLLKNKVDFVIFNRSIIVKKKNG